MARFARYATCLLALLAAAPELHADPIGGRELSIGPGFLFFDDELAVGADAAGNIVSAFHVYSDEMAPLAHPEIGVRRFDLNGTILGPDFEANVYTTGVQMLPTVAVHSSGNFVIAWATQAQDGDGFGIFARRFDPSGAPVAGEFQVNTYTTGDQLNPAAASLPDGGFVVVWQGAAGQDGSGMSVAGRRFDAGGLPVGGEFQVNTYTTGNQSDPAIASGPGGSFLVTWSGFGPEETADAGIYARRYDAGGSPLGPELHVNTSAPDVQDDPAVATDAAGNSVIAWVDASPGLAGKNVFARRFDGTGAPLGTDFQVNGYVTGEQADPVVAMDSASGAFIILYRSERGDLRFEGGNVYGRRYDGTGVALGAEFQVNTIVPKRQTPGGVILDPSGDFTVVWTSVFTQAPNRHIEARRYTDPAAVPVSGKRLFMADDADPTRRRIVFQSNDNAVSSSPGVSANPVADGAVLHVFNGNGSGESACIALPAVHWSASGPGDEPLYVYQDTSGTSGPCFKAMLRGGRRALLKATCRATQQPIPYSLDEPTQGSVAVSVSSGSATYCTLFGGTVAVDSGTARKFSARKAGAPGACPVPPVSCP